MQKHYASRSGLFLIELIFSIFFFIIATVIVLQLFVKSHLICESTININNTLLYTQNISEVFLAGNGDFDTVKALYAEQLPDYPGMRDDVMLLFFDQDWTPVKNSNDAKYVIFANYENDEHFAYINIYINQYLPNIDALIANGNYHLLLTEKGSIYHQEVKKYVRK